MGIRTVYNFKNPKNMFKERESVIAKVSVGLQVILTVACFFLISYITGGPASTRITPSGEVTGSVIIIALLWFIILDQFNLGRIFRTSGYLSILINYMKAVITGTGFLLAGNLLLEYETFSPARLAYFGILNFLVLTSYKNILFTVMRFLRRNGFNKRQILIIADEESSGYIDQIIDSKDWGMQIRAIMTNSKKVRNKYSSEYEIIPNTRDIKLMLDNNPIDDVIYCRSFFNQTEIQQYIADCAEIGVAFHYQTKVVDMEKAEPSVSLLNQLPFISYKNARHRYLSLKIKAAFDFFFSLVVIILSSPVQALIAVAIKLDDGGPAFFKQERVGLNGRRFYCLKFRTMVVDAEALKAQLMGQNEQEGPVFKISMDPRVTRIGRFLRKTSLDELPQFVNVLRGEMSVVGPRPPLPSEVEQYERWQIRRLSMKPGITCIWQVSGRNNIPFQEWMRLDMEYIDNRSLKLDLILILKTIKVML
jgi:exopolysaccharide biosynthesis polyprenyl glycosylphosphotransferase